MVACKKRPVHPQSGSRLYHPWSQSKLNIKSGLCSEFRHASTPSEYNLLCESIRPIKCQSWPPRVACAGSRSAGGSHGTNGSLPFHFFLRCPPPKHWTIRGKQRKREKGTGEGKSVLLCSSLLFPPPPLDKRLRFFSPLLRVDSSTSRVSDSWS